MAALAFYGKVVEALEKVEFSIKIQSCLTEKVIFIILRNLCFFFVLFHCSICSS